MISISQNALTEFDRLFRETPKQYLRIYFDPQFNKKQLAFCIDKLREDDETEEICEFLFCYTKDIMDTCGGIHITTTHLGFAIEPVIPLNSN